MKKTFALFFVFMLIFSAVKAQDTIVLKSGISILATIKYLDTDSVCFQQSGGPMLCYSKSEIKRIGFFQSPEVTQDRVNAAQIPNVTQTYLNCIKSSYMAPMTGQYLIAWEHSLLDSAYDRSFEVLISAISQNRRNEYSVSGYEGKVGGFYSRLTFRWFPHGNLKKPGTIKGYNMTGWFYGLSTSFGGFRYRDDNMYYDNILLTYITEVELVDVYKLTFELVAGINVPLGGRFTMGLTAGMGAGFMYIGSGNRSHYEIPGYQFSNLNPDRFSFIGNVLLGYRFIKP